MTEILSTSIDVAAVRARFSSLRPGFAFLDAPGGSQVPDEVGNAIARALREASANLGAVYATSLRVGEILEEAEAKAARFLGCGPHEVIFGPNMTSLNFALSRSAARDYRPGDEILVSSLDHDGGVAPWLELAHDKNLVVRHVGLNDDTTLDVGDLERKLGPRTRVVAFAWASNAVGTVVDARRVCKLAHDAGALAWVDAVHYAAHEPIDVREVGADVLICSPYKFCGPHLGVAYGRAEVVERWRPYKARPAPTQPLGRRFETGTLPYELLAGFNAAIDYLESVGGFAAIVPYERSLGQRFLDGISDAVTVYGLPGMAGCRPCYPGAPLRISASLLRLMLPPETTHTTFPLPARPVSAAADASAPAPSAITRARSASVRTAAATSLTPMDRARSTSGATSGHMLSSTRRLPEPSTNEAR